VVANEILAIANDIEHNIVKTYDVRHDIVIAYDR
jgi:hypothetical protein